MKLNQLLSEAHTPTPDELKKFRETVLKRIQADNLKLGDSITFEDIFGEKQSDEEKTLMAKMFQGQKMTILTTNDCKIFRHSVSMDHYLHLDDVEFNVVVKEYIQKMAEVNGPGVLVDFKPAVSVVVQNPLNGKQSNKRVQSAAISFDDIHALFPVDSKWLNAFNGKK